MLQQFHDQHSIELHVVVNILRHIVREPNSQPEGRRRLRGMGKGILVQIDANSCRPDACAQVQHPESIKASQVKDCLRWTF